MLVSKLLRLPERGSDEAKKAVRLERQLGEARRVVKEQRARVAILERERDRLRVGVSPTTLGPRASLDAERLLDAAATALRASPPAGVESAYVDAFLRRKRRELVGLVRAAFSA